MKRICCFFLIFGIHVCLTLDAGVAEVDIQSLKDLSLEALLDTEISTATKYEQTISEAPASVTIITAEEIERYGYQTLAEALISVRGFYTSYGRYTSYIGVRGFSRPTDYNNRILILFNGHTLNENIFNSVFPGTGLGMNIDAIEQIEVVRGPSSVLYGTNAMFAVVNLITESGRSVDGLRLSAKAGGYGMREGSVVFGKKLGNGMDISISGIWGDIKGQDLYYEEFDDPTTNEGIAEDLDWDKYYGVQSTITFGDFTFNGFLASREKGVPTGAWKVVFNDDADNTLDQRSFLELEYDNAIGGNKNFMLRGYADYFYERGSFPYVYGEESVLPQFIGTVQEVDNFEKTNGMWVGGELQFRWDLQSHNRLTIGAEYQDHFKASYQLSQPSVENRIDSSGSGLLLCHCDHAV